MKASKLWAYRRRRCEPWDQGERALWTLSTMCHDTLSPSWLEVARTHTQPDASAPSSARLPPYSSQRATPMEWSPRWGLLDCTQEWWLGWNLGWMQCLVSLSARGDCVTEILFSLLIGETASGETRDWLWRLWLALRGVESFLSDWRAVKTVSPHSHFVLPRCPLCRNKIKVSNFWKTKLLNEI